MGSLWRKAGVAVVMCGMLASWGCEMEGLGSLFDPGPPPPPAPLPPPKLKFAFSYVQPARVKVPPHIRTLAVMPEGDSQSDDAQWGQEAADKVIKYLKEENAQGRYDIVERAALQRMLEEADLQAAFGDPDTAARSRGKLKAVDAIVYVRAQTNTETRRAAQGGYSRRLATVKVSCKLVDLSNGSLAAAHNDIYEFDSARDDKKNTRTSMDRIVGDLIEQGVQDFVAGISAHTVNVETTLASGKRLQSGNELALAGKYAAALEHYRAAMEKNAEDHGAVFNAGLMYEAMGKFKDAREMYAKAATIIRSENVQYTAAVARMRR